VTSNSAEGANESASRYITPDGWAIVPPQIAHWLEKRAEVNAGTRARLRETNWDAYLVLTSLHAVALQYRRSDPGTNTAVGDHERSDSEVWMSTSEAAAELGVTDRCIRKWIHNKRLQAIKPGCRWLINRNDVDIFKLSE
jgi:excisionase family DNA binding protein